MQYALSPAVFQPPLDYRVMFQNSFERLTVTVYTRLDVYRLQRNLSRLSHFQRPAFPIRNVTT